MRKLWKHHWLPEFFCLMLSKNQFFQIFQTSNHQIVTKNDGFWVYNTYFSGEILENRIKVAIFAPTCSPLLGCLGSTTSRLPYWECGVTTIFETSKMVYSRPIREDPPTFFVSFYLLKWRVSEARTVPLVTRM